MEGTQKRIFGSSLMRTENDEYDRFPIAKRGYDPNAVEAYLDLAAADSDRMLNEAAARIAALELEVEEAKKQEEAVHLTILAATKAKEDMIEAAKHQAAELCSNGRKEGDRIVTDARMQAFQLVTGARKEAETIVGEARAEAAAIARVEGEAAAANDGPSEREIALHQRIEEMQQAIAAMEVELASRPAASVEKHTSPVDMVIEEALEPAVEIPTPAAEAQVAPSVPEATMKNPPPPADARDDDGDEIEIVVSDLPAEESTIDIAADDTEITLTEDDEALEPAFSRAVHDTGINDDSDDRAAAVRRSFYSRRSAGLPHMGSEAGRGAMAAVAGLRTNFVAPEADDDTDPEQTPAFEAV